MSPIPHIALVCSIALAAPTFGQELVGGEWQDNATFSGTTAFPLGAGAFGVPDLNGDGAEDIAMPNRAADEIALFDGSNGQLIRTLNFSGFAGGADEFACAGDVNNDGTVDFFVRRMSSSIPLVVASGTNGVALLTILRPGPEFDSMGYVKAPAGDVDGDGHDDIMVGNYHASFNYHGSGVVLVYSGATGNLIHHINGTFIDATLGTNLAAAGDRNNDGYDDFLVASSGHYAVSGWYGEVSLFTGTLLWTVPSPANTFDCGLVTLLWANDLDGDGDGDFIVSVGSESVAYSGSTQQEIRRYSASNLTLLPDLDGDRVADLCRQHFPSPSTNVLVISGKSGLTMLDFSNEINTVSALRPSSPSEKAQLLIGYPNVAAVNSYVETKEFHPFLVSSVSQLSISQGGDIILPMDFGAQHAHQAYRILISGAGMGPIYIGSVQVPLEWDNFLTSTWYSQYPRLSFQPEGNLSPAGTATAGFRLLPGQRAALVGQKLWIAAVVFDNGLTDGSSVAVEIEFTP